MAAPERVGISQYRVARAPQVLVCYGLGSCLGIAIHDPELKLGGLAHTLLPMARPEQEERQSKFVDAAIKLLVADLLQEGAAPERLVAKIVGGANMFSGSGLGGDYCIGMRNVAAARQVLGELGIPLLAEDVGGDFGRTVEFDLDSGILLVRAVRNREEQHL